LTENVPRVLPDGFCARIDLTTWERPAIFSWLQEHGNVEEAEMLRTFNCGIGMVVAVPANELEKSLKYLREMGEQAVQIGTVEACAGEAQVVFG
jgi:phosphoribosylformylglycinamidine cyclo-ligase